MVFLVSFLERPSKLNCGFPCGCSLEKSRAPQEITSGVHMRVAVCSMFRGMANLLVLGKKPTSHRLGRMKPCEWDKPPIHLLQKRILSSICHLLKPKDIHFSYVSANILQLSSTQAVQLEIQIHQSKPPTAPNENNEGSETSQLPLIGSLEVMRWFSYTLQKPAVRIPTNPNHQLRVTLT